MEDWRDWYDVLSDSGRTFFGHDPDPAAARHGDVVRLTVDSQRDGSPTIELPVAELRRLLAGAERDLADFLVLAANWVSQYLPAHAAPVTAALARVLDMPSPTRIS